MARKIRRFLVFMLFSLFFTMFSKKFQSTDTSSKTNTLASVKGRKSQSAVVKVLSSVMGVNSAEAWGCYEAEGSCEIVCDPIPPNCQ